MANYHTDQALQSADEDLFGRARYAENIAKVIHSQPIDEKYVIGLYSPWGYGKSSILNMMQSHLENDSTLVVPFNPWIYTDLNSMTVGLLTEIAREVNDTELGYRNEESPILRRKKVKRWAKRQWRMIKTRGFRNSISGSIGSLAEAANVSSHGVSIGKSVALAAKSVGKDSFTTLKKNVEADIEKLGKRVVVVIDDVDRLDKDEIFQLFKLVKAVADFKGITYVIAFDNIAVAKALNGRFSGGTGLKDGMDFLEKIIQIPLSLPYIPTEELRDMFVEGVNSLLDEYKLEVSDEDSSRFWDVFDNHILPHLKTPRSIKRYLNLLTFTLPLANNEVNVTDVIALTGLKLLYPATYERIQREKSLLTGQTIDYFIDDDKRRENNKKKFESLVQDEEGASSILSSLFPVISQTYGGSKSWEDSDEKLKENRRVASNDYFDRYFVFGIGSSDVSDYEVEDILKMEDVEKITKTLKSIVKDAKSQQLTLTKISQYKKEIANVSVFLKGLIGASGSLDSSQQSGFFSRSGVEVLSDLVFDIIRNASVDKLNDIVEIINLCDDTELLTYIVRDINLNFQDKSEKTILSEEEFRIFKTVAVKKIEELSKSVKFYEAPRKVSYILYQYWQDYTEDDSVTKYLEASLKNSDDVLDFLTNYLATWSGGRGQRRGDFNQASFDTVAKLIDPKKLYEKLQKEDKSLASVNGYVKLEHRDDDSDVNKVGNEKSEEFRKIVAQQFSYLYHQSLKKDGTEQAT